MSREADREHPLFAELRDKAGLFFGTLNKRALGDGLDLAGTCLPPHPLPSLA